MGNREAPAAITEFTSEAGGGGGKDLAGLFKIEFSAADAWLEEDERIYVHPKDPYKVNEFLAPFFPRRVKVTGAHSQKPKRVDVLQSSRQVRVALRGVELALTTRPRLLFETGLRVRTYVPLTDVRVDLLRPSDTTTECPYKVIWPPFCGAQCT